MLCLGEIHLCNAYSGTGVSQLADVMEPESNNYFFACICTMYTIDHRLKNEYV